LPDRRNAPPLPVLTASAVTVAILAAVVQYTVPAAIPALQRDPDRLAHGQWWRAVTPLLVQLADRSTGP